MILDNWFNMITEEMSDHDDCWGDVVYQSLNEDELMKDFDAGYGSEEGRPFFVWTHDRVYFPVCYDGSEWVGSVPRHPTSEEPQHFGGG